MDEYPRKGELVVGTVSEIVDYGAFIDLDEYEDKEALCHVSEIASGWVKHIKDHVQEGQKVVAKVLEVKPEKHQINVSVKDVNEHQRRERIREWKAERKAKAWLDIAAERMDADPEEVEADLKKQFGGLYPAFEEAALGGVEALDISEEWASAVVEVADENVEIPKVDIEGYVDLQTYAPRGVEDVRDALRAAESIETDATEELEVEYMGAPRYRIKVTAPDYKAAESTLKSAADEAIDSMVAAGGSGEFHRELEEEQ